jgi:hypothetical protein
VPDAPAKQEGVQVGEIVARGLLAIRTGDGSNVAPLPFVPGTNPGDYRPTPPNLAASVFSNWGSVTPFVLDSGDQFRPAPPPTLTSPEYASAINEVQSLGSATSTTRTADQTVIGKFWAPPIRTSGTRSARPSPRPTTLISPPRPVSRRRTWASPMRRSASTTPSTYQRWRR